jgi:hypothetical protein
MFISGATCRRTTKPFNRASGNRFSATNPRGSPLRRESRLR